MRAFLGAARNDRLRSILAVAGDDYCGHHCAAAAPVARGSSREKSCRGSLGAKPNPVLLPARPSVDAVSEIRGIMRMAF
jgi:hypothetical protein